MQATIERTTPEPAVALTAKGEAVRHLYRFVRALRDLSDADYYAVVELLRSELAVLDQPAD